MSHPYLTKHVRSDHQRQQAKEAAADLIAWMWAAFIVVLIVGSALLTITEGNQ